MEKSELIVKMVLRSGIVNAFYVDEQTLAEMMSHPKFLKMRDDCNDIFISIEDIAGFELLNTRKEKPKPVEINGENQPNSIQQA